MYADSVAQIDALPKCHAHVNTSCSDLLPTFAGQIPEPAAPLEVPDTRFPVKNESIKSPFGPALRSKRRKARRSADKIHPNTENINTQKVYIKGRTREGETKSSA